MPGRSDRVPQGKRPDGSKGTRPTRVSGCTSMLRINTSPRRRTGSGRPGPRAPLRRTAATALLSLSVVIGLTVRLDPPSGPTPRPTGSPVAATGSLAAMRAVATVAARVDPHILDPRPILDREASALWSDAPVAAGLVPGRAVAVLAAATPAVANAPAQKTASLPDTARNLQASLPVARPPELRSAGAAARPRLAARRPARRARMASAPQPDTRTFFDKLLGVAPPPPPAALAYAALDPAPVEPGPVRRLNPMPAPDAQAGIAVYDISARTVTLPGGERLEAHSGLGAWLDDPRYVHARMRGATPPGTYDLTMRERLFHGVRALRLNPVGGSAAIFGRAGLLAHTFMLGPNGDSNGCVSFRNYDRFLQAYLRGEIRRLVVVAGNGQDRLPGGRWFSLLGGQLPRT